MTSHIAMFSIAAHGHVNPSLEVIRELAARGHRVTYAMPPAFAEKVAETGAEPKLWHSTLPGSDADPQAWGTTLLDNVEPFLNDAIQALPQLIEAYERDEPDLVLHDITAYPAPVLARLWGVKAISLSPNLVAWDGYEEEVAEPMWAEPKKTERGKAYYTRFQDWLDENGMDLLVSLGSSFTKQPDFYRECVKAFGDLPGWHMVLQVGRHVDPAELGEIPANVEVRDWVPQPAILEQADAFITHAGAGGSQEGLATATPMVAVPQAVDQFGNADMLQSLGVARHVPMAEATAETLREAVLALVDDPEAARRLKEVREGMAREGGTRRAADLIETELASGK